MDVISLAKIRQLKAEIDALAALAIPDIVTETAVALDPAAKGTGVTLSGGDLTASQVLSGWQMALATLARSSGKYYFEFVPSEIVNGVAGGLALSTADKNSWLDDGAAVGGNEDKTWGYSSSGGWTGIDIANSAGFTAGDVIGVAADLDAGTLSFYQNNVYMRRWTGLTAGLSYYPAVSLNGDGYMGEASATIRFAAASLSYAPPDGYAAWGIETADGKVLTAGNEDGEFGWASIPDKTLGLLNIASLPAHYERSDKWASGGSDTDVKRRTVVSPTRLTVNVNDVGYLLASAVSMDLDTAANWDSTATDYTVAANRAGKDFYIYACQPSSGIAPVIKLSANSTVPSGYTATTSRKIGGFHCLCVAVGTISGHTLTGYLAGDILPASVWDLKHRPASNPEGMVYVDRLNLWVDIFLQSGTGTSTASVNGGTIADTRTWNDHVDDLAAVKKVLLDDIEFQVAAEGCNQQTNITGSADPVTTTGHVDTAARRMISNYGIEDAAGAMYQWLRDQSWQYGPDGSVADGAKTAAVTYAASPGGNPIYLKWDKGVPYLCSNLATAAADRVVTFSTDYKLILVHDAAAATGGLPVYFDDDATQPSRLLCNNTLLGKNCRVPTNDASYFLNVVHSASAATLGVALYYDDGADNRLEAANASAANQNLSLAIASLAWTFYAVPGSKGSLYRQGTTGDTKLLAGGYWTYGSPCGSRCRVAYVCRWNAHAFVAGRGRAEPA